MSEPSRLDRTFQIILKYFMETGQAPHYTEIASELDVPAEEGINNVSDGVNRRLKRHGFFLAAA